MRERDEIKNDHHSYEVLSLEVLLDIRDLSRQALDILKPAPLYVKEPKEIKEVPKVKRKRRTKKEMAAAKRK